MINPIRVQLSITDALAVNLHKEVFLFNGFKVQSAQEADAKDAHNPNEYLIRSLPYSKKTVFNTDDFMELVQIINEHLDYSREDTSTTSFRVGITDRSRKTDKGGDTSLMHKELLRPKKVYSMLANRACRSSIMVGRTLDQKTMKKVVTNLATLESPWNCPHGRPTLRFVKKLNQPKQDEEVELIKAHKFVLPSRGR